MDTADVAPTDTAIAADMGIAADMAIEADTADVAPTPVADMLGAA
jgi:hypothetical protein